MSIGANIVKLRNHHHLSQFDFGKIANVSDKTVSDWEREKITPRMPVLQRIADHFGMKKSDLIEENGVENYFNNVVSTPQSFPISDDETNLVYRYRRLDQNARNAIWSMIKAFDERDSQPPQQSQLAI